MKNLFNIEGKRVLITGGTSGLGEMMVKGFSENGAKVVFCGRNVDRGGIIVRSANAIFIKCNLMDGNEIENLITKTSQILGGIDILINNAGIAPYNDAKYKDEIIATNLGAMIQLSSLCLPTMSPYSKIINIASVAGIKPTNFNNYWYTVSKSGVIAFTKQFAKKATRHQINVNAIALGIFKTPMTKNVLNRFEKSVLSTIPACRFGQVKDIVGTAIFLASEASNYIYGETICLDGGSVNCV